MREHRHQRRGGEREGRGEEDELAAVGDNGTKVITLGPLAAGSAGAAH